MTRRGPSGGVSITAPAQGMRSSQDAEAGGRWAGGPFPPNAGYRIGFLCGAVNYYKLRPETTQPFCHSPRKIRGPGRAHPVLRSSIFPGGNHFKKGRRRGGGGGRGGVTERERERERAAHLGPDLWNICSHGIPGSCRPILCHFSSGLKAPPWHPGSHQSVTPRELTRLPRLPRYLSGLVTSTPFSSHAGLSAAPNLRPEWTLWAPARFPGGPPTLPPLSHLCSHASFLMRSKRTPLFMTFQKIHFIVTLISTACLPSCPIPFSGESARLGKEQGRRLGFAVYRVPRTASCLQRVIH